MKILLYSQHVLGIGHFFRSMEIARALHHHEVLFVEGGEPLPGFAAPPHVQRFLLPPLMMDAEFKSMEARGGRVEELKAERAKLFAEAFLNFGPRILLTELFPFGRRQFRFELLPVLRMIREEKIATTVICSLRDILVEKTDRAGYEAWVLEQLNQYYDLLLIHSDPLVIALEETFTQVDKISIPVRYTGFVAKPLPAVKKDVGRNVIVASSGGGKVGADLLAAAIKAVQSLPDRNLVLRVFVGPFMGEVDRDSLLNLAAQDPRTKLQAFSPDFLAELLAADLSISMAGYNTCMDLLNTRIKAIVYPFPQNREQGLRAKKLEGLGLVRVVERLDEVLLAKTIVETMAAVTPSPALSLNLAGAHNTSVLIDGLAFPLTYNQE